LHYWRSKYSAEIDFIVTIEGGVIPVEVKASTNTKSKSLKRYCDLYSPDYAVKISAKNYSNNGKTISLPLYAVHLIKDLKIKLSNT